MAVDAGLPQRSIAVAAGQQLTLLDSDGEQRWQLPLDAPTAPVAIAAYDFETDGDEDILSWPTWSISARDRAALGVSPWRRMQ